MGGTIKISTPAVIKSSPRFPYLRSKMGTVSAASPLLSGKMSTRESLFLILNPFSLIYLPKAYSKGVTRRGYTAILIKAQGLHPLVMSVS